MRFLRIILSTTVVISMTLCSACGSNEVNNVSSNTGSEFAESTVSEQVMLQKNYKIYLMQDFVGEQELPKTANGISVMVWGSGSYISSLGKAIEDDSAQRKKSLVIDGETYELPYDSTRGNELYYLSDPQLKKCGIWDEYWSKDAHVSACFDKEGRLTFFVNTAKDSSGNGWYPEEKAKARAEEILKELYGNDILEKYSEYKTDRLEDSHFTRIYYYRQVAGCLTEECISVAFNNKGELTSINALYMGRFDSLAERITEKHITNAENALLEAFPTYTLINDDVKRIIIKPSGNYYLQQKIHSEQEKNGYLLYINVE